MDIILSFVMALSFLTYIPMPMIEWTDKRIKIMPFMFPIVGAVIGTLLVLLFKGLHFLPISDLLSAVLFTVFTIAITGGLHMDGLMDMADGYFSRRDIPRKLEIMTDSHVGAFAVMTFGIVLLTKTVFIFEVFTKSSSIFALIFFIPIMSRIMQASMLYLFPFAKQDGLAKMYGDSLKPYKGYIFWVLLLVLCLVLYLIGGFMALLLPLILVLFYILFFFSTKKNFGGITGDMLGAFVELSELIMFGVLAIFF